MSALEILPIVLLGIVCGLDVVSFPQGMISRPIVAATAAGALGGHGPLVAPVRERVCLPRVSDGC